MELVYLWVEKYKNIEEQGFNFSPKFKCDYNPNTKKLTIKKQNDYIENFFSNNINITAIIGKNGSGKSSVLECIDLGIKSFIENDDTQFSASYPNFKKYILIYKNDTEYFNLGNIPIKYINLKNRSDNYVHIKNFIDKNLYYTYQENQNLVESILKTFYSLDSKYITFFKPDTLILDFFNGGNNFDAEDAENTLEDKLTKIIDSKFNNIKDRLCQIDTELNQNETSIDTFTQSLETFTGIDILQDIYNENIEMLQSLLFIQNNMDIVLPNITSISTDDNLYYKIRTPINETTKDFLLHLDKLRLDILKIYDSRFNEINEEDYKNFGISFDSLSQGEKSFLNILLDIKNKLEDTQSKNLNICIFIDEPENNFHPQWQKSFISELIKILKIFKINIHLVISTHSPFLLSDIPKQNIIFLDTDEKSKCKVVDGLNDKKETFGANIHTLLSDSFFMDGGLMGEFAKGKIDEVFDLLTKTTITKEEQKSCEEIISIIGEPIIKRQLQKMLDSKRLSKIDKIDELQKQIEALQQQVKELKIDA